MQRQSFLTLTVAVKKFLSSSVAGFESVHSVQKNGGNYVSSVVAAAEFLHSGDGISCMFNRSKGFQKRINLLRPDV